MEITELRVGNIISSKSAKSPFEVTVSDFEYINEHIDNYLSVEITDKILNKFGFEKIIGWADQIYYREKDWREKGCSFFELQLNEKDFIFTDFNNIIIESVHQLQNLFFALTNNELTL